MYELDADVTCNSCRQQKMLNRLGWRSGRFMYRVRREREDSNTAHKTRNNESFYASVENCRVFFLSFLDQRWQNQWLNDQVCMYQ